MSQLHDTGRSSATAAVLLVTKREIVARIANRSFIIGTLVNVAVILGLLFFFRTSGKEEPQATVAVSGISASSLATSNHGVQWRNISDSRSARQDVSNGQADAAVIMDKARTTIIVREGTSPQARGAVEAVARQWATGQALKNQHVDVKRYQADVTASLPQVQKVSGGQSGAMLGAAIGIVTILFFQLFGYGTMVAQGVVEEKSTRVVEVLLATLTPLRLMVGKVLGIGAAAVLQLAILGATVGVAVEYGHVLPAQFPATAVVLAAVGWFVLGFLFFAFLFAAAGSLVSRAEEVGSAVMPILMATMVPFGVAVAASQDLDAAWVGILQYIPPFSMLVMPLQVSVHAAGLWPNILAALLMIAAAGGLAVLAGRIYQRSILRVGASVRWGEALKGSS